MIREENSSFSFFWLPFIALPIVTLLNIKITIETPTVPVKFYQNQLDYFDHRNAIITYWDNTYSKAYSSHQSLEYFSKNRFDNQIKIDSKNESQRDHPYDFKFELSLEKSKSNWILSTHPQWVQIPKIHKLINTQVRFEQRALQLLLSWKTNLIWSDINSAKLPQITELVLKINNLQNSKSNQDIQLWLKNQNALHKLLTLPENRPLMESLENYLKYQRALLLLEVASRIPEKNLIHSLQFVRNYELLDSFYLDGNNLFALPKSGFAMEVNVLIDPKKTIEHQYKLVRKLNSEARILLQKFDINKAPWEITVALARSYQIEIKDPNIKRSQKVDLDKKINELIIPDSKQSLASRRSSIHPNGADFRLKDSYYLKRLSRNLARDIIRLIPVSVDNDNNFSDAIQTLKFNEAYYVIDTYARDCYKMQDNDFKKISRLPINISPLAQAVIQPDPVLAQPRVFLFGGYPSSKLSFTSNNLIQFNPIKQLSPFDGRFYFGMSQFLSASSGLEKTILIGGTKGKAKDIARFQDVYSTMDGITWLKLPSMNWTSRHSFGLAQLDNLLLAFGGCRTYQSECFSEIWSTENGTEFTKLTDAPWEPRGGMAFALGPQGLFIFGGANQNKVFADLWKTSDGKSWVQIPISTLGSVNSQLIIDEDNFWILGGKTKHGRSAPTRHFKISLKGVQFL